MACTSGMGAVAGLALSFLVAAGAPDAHGASRRSECAQACAARIAQCASTCGQFTNLEAACRRGILKRCRREGPGMCETPTTSTSSTSTVTTTTRTTTTRPPGESCTQPLGLTIPETVNGDTTDRIDNGAGRSCMTNPDGPDLVYRLVPAATGTLRFTINSAWDSGIYVRTTCDDPETEVACVDQQGGGTDEVVDVAVTAGVPYWVFVDGYTGDQFGAFTMSVTALP